MKNSGNSKIKAYQLIFSPQLAVFLLHSGYTIVDLKPKHNAENETVFVFKNEAGLQEQILLWVNEEK